MLNEVQSYDAKLSQVTVNQAELSKIGCGSPQSDAEPTWISKTMFMLKLKSKSLQHIEFSQSVQRSLEQLSKTWFS